MKGKVEIGDFDVGQLVILCDAGVVDDDVDLEPGVRSWGRGEEAVLGGGNEGRGALGRTKVGLYAKGLDAVFALQLLGELLGEGGGGLGGVVQDEVAAFRGEVFGDGSPNSWLVCE